MKIAFMSDVHANPRAFITALDDAKEQGCDSVKLLGDVVGYGYDPNACIDMARKECDEVVLGNHDAGVISKLRLDWFAPHSLKGVLRHKEQVADGERLDWLNSLQYVIVDADNGYVATHGSLIDPPVFDYMDPFYCAGDLRLMRRNHPECKVLFCGHTHDAFMTAMPTHPQLGVDYTKRVTVLADDDACKNTIALGEHYAVVNIGSVGFPRDLGSIVYVIYDTQRNTVTFRWLPFDFPAYINDMREAGVELPRWIGRWHLV